MAVEYQPDIHQLLSPNDNKWHGIAKDKWKQLRRERMIGSEDGVQSSLLLLKSLIEIKPENIKKIFKRN